MINWPCAARLKREKWKHTLCEVKVTKYEKKKYRAGKDTSKTVARHDGMRSQREEKKEIREKIIRIFLLNVAAEANLIQKKGQRKM